MPSDNDSLWAEADRSRRIETRLNCPCCSKQPGDKTLAMNTEKRVGLCFRCGWTLSGEAPDNFIAKSLDDLEKERLKRAFKFNQIKATCRPISEGDLVQKYLLHRLGARPPTWPRLGYSQAVRYYTGLNNYKTTGAMVAALQDATGRCTGWHITHLSVDGKKAFGSDSRRYCKLHSLKGSAVRLYPATETLIVAEGIETALALHLVANDPVWACTSASMLKAFEPPPGVETLIIAGDNDANSVGQNAAWSLYHRLKHDFKCSVMVPDRENTDWLDMLRDS